MQEEHDQFEMEFFPLPLLLLNNWLKSERGRQYILVLEKVDFVQVSNVAI